MHELARHTTVAGLCAQWQTNYGTVVVAILEQGHVEDLLEWLELIFELFDIVRVVFEIEYGHVAAFVGRESLVRVNKGYFVAAQDGYKV